MPITYSFHWSTLFSSLSHLTHCVFTHSQRTLPRLFHKLLLMPVSLTSLMLSVNCDVILLCFIWWCFWCNLFNSTFSLTAQFWGCILLFALTPSSSQTGKTTAFSGANKCVKCDKTVYKMEEIIAVGHVWHNSCFTCGKLWLYFFFVPDLCGFCLWVPLFVVKLHVRQDCLNPLSSPIFLLRWHEHRWLQQNSHSRQLCRPQCSALLQCEWLYFFCCSRYNMCMLSMCCCGLIVCTLQCRNLEASCLIGSWKKGVKKDFSHLFFFCTQSCYNKQFRSKGFGNSLAGEYGGVADEHN